ncbi:MAG: hypothetical protein OXM01_03475 [Gemmatimonadota bacterium]|nr:hypothetical protein [Gemmatimonadota bacterium]
MAAEAVGRVAEDAAAGDNRPETGAGMNWHSGRADRLAPAAAGSGDGPSGAPGRQFVQFKGRGAHHAFLPIVPHLRTMHGKNT